MERKRICFFGTAHPSHLRATRKSEKVYAMCPLFLDSKSRKQGQIEETCFNVSLHWSFSSKRRILFSECPDKCHLSEQQSTYMISET